MPPVLYQRQSRESPQARAPCAGPLERPDARWATILSFHSCRAPRYNCEMFSALRTSTALQQSELATRSAVSTGMCGHEVAGSRILPVSSGCPPLSCRPEPVRPRSWVRFGGQQLQLLQTEGQQRESGSQRQAQTPPQHALTSPLIVQIPVSFYVYMYYGSLYVHSRLVPNAFRQAFSRQAEGWLHIYG